MWLEIFTSASLTCPHPLPLLRHPHPPTAQLSSLATLPPADRQLREPALLSKRATVETWLTREANTLQKYRLVRRPTPDLGPYRLAAERSCRQLQRFLCVYCICMAAIACLCAGPGGEAPENTAAVEEAADHHSGRRADPVEETAAAGRQRGPAGGRPGHPAVVVSASHRDHSHGTLSQSKGSKVYELRN